MTALSGDAGERLAAALTKHALRRPYFCSCGWEGDSIVVHLLDVLAPIVAELADLRAAEELRAAADGAYRTASGMNVVEATDLRARAAALTSPDAPEGDRHE